MKLKIIIIILGVIIILLFFTCKINWQDFFSDTKRGFQREVQDLPNGTAARVDGIIITEKQVVNEMRPMMVQLNRDYSNREQDGKYLHSKRIIRGRAIESLITMALIGREMKKNNIVVTREEIDIHIEKSANTNAMTIEQLRAFVTNKNNQSFEEWKKQMQYDKRLGVIKIVEVKYKKELKINEADTRQYYQNHRQMFTRPKKVRVSHILIKSVTSVPTPHRSRTDTMAKSIIKKLLKQITQGADFAELAKKYSEDKSAENGGDLGYATNREWVPQFSEVAFALKVGQVSDLVKTPYGYHIIKVTAKQDSDLISFEDAKDKIIEILKTDRITRLRFQYIETLRNNAKIEYGPGNLITLTPLMVP